jgi:hypothetical protein
MCLYDQHSSSVGVKPFLVHGIVEFTCLFRPGSRSLLAAAAQIYYYTATIARHLQNSISISLFYEFDF